MSEDGTENEDEPKVMIPFNEGPCFNFKPSVPFDMLEDWVATLRRQNLSRVEASGKFDGLFINTRSMEFLCVLCELLNVPPNVKFVAARLFDAFMLKHVQASMDERRRSKWSKSCKDKEWRTIEDKICSQVALRVFSCVQIASKLENSVQVRCVQIGDFNRLLRTMGLCYTNDHILKSELRIMRTLHYKLNVASPLVFVETFLKILNMENAILPVDAWYHWSVMILEAVFLLRDEIYGLWAKAVISNTVAIERRGLARVQNDYVLLASSVIVAGAYAVSGLEVSMEVAKLLSRVAGVSFQDISQFCSVFIRLVLTKSSRASVETNGLVKETMPLRVSDSQF